MIITYHEILRQASQYRYAVSVTQMNDHLEYLRRVSAAGRPKVTLTFDDGLISHRELAAPLLENAGLCGMFFVTPKPIGTAGYMDISQLRELAGSSHEIQSHGWSHSLLPCCRPAELRMELERSKKMLEDWLGREVDAIAVPGGAYNSAVLRAAAEAGYRRLYTSDWWQTPALREGIHVTGRLMICNSFTVCKLEQSLAAEGRRFSVPELAQRSRRAVRAMLGYSLYRTLWSLAARRHDQL